MGALPGPHLHTLRHEGNIYMNHAVTFEGVSYAFGDFKALNELSLDIKEGEYVAIVGKNGSGKSTLARHINALLRPQAGKVITFGLDTGNDDKVIEIRRSAGMVFQNPDNQIVASVIEEDVAFGPENLGIPPAEIRERVDNALKTVDMYENRLRAPHMLSGGQKQRVAIAGVLAMKPNLIVFDEPTSMLDPSGRKAVLKAIEKLHDEGITIIHITHWMEEAAMADRIIVVNSGKVVLDGTPSEVFNKYASALEEYGLELPPLMKIAQELKKLGIDAGDGLDIEDMVDKICRLL